MSNANIYNKLRAWVKTSSQGILIPGSVQFRKVRPVGKGWHELTLNYCCGADTDSIIIFRNTTAASNITSITTTDGAINWTGTLANGGVLALVIPSGYDETFTIVTSAFSGRTLTTAVAQGTGTVDAIGSISSNTNTTSTSAGGGNQFTVVLS